ncbi:MAG: shikimate kinase [Paludibacteraceae bacterium]|nr:shikimate kinase [Paludibacteraceae bacterium]
MKRNNIEPTDVLNRPIYLIGYMAAGKTTVGKFLAGLLGWRFVDLDDAFLQIHGYTTAEYIRQFGIDAFRIKEKYVAEDVADMSPFDNVVYATGGGYPCYEDNMECLKELGTSVYLRWKAEDLVKRLMLTDLSQRPVLQGRTEEELLTFVAPQLQAREPYYAKADYTIEAPGFIPEADQIIAEQICQLVKYKTR